uniref:Uncharacterized protein n=1 Tax=Micrurus carvalhoi TaxID=3147026 RepID=A0A2H6N4T7_9SAUR
MILLAYSKAGIPNPQSVDRHQSTACQQLVPQKQAKSDPWDAGVTSPLWSAEKLLSTEPVSGAQKELQSTFKLCSALLGVENISCLLYADRNAIEKFKNTTHL